MGNILTTKELGEYRQAIIDELAVDSMTTGAELEAIIDPFDSNKQLDRLTQVVDNIKSTHSLNNVAGGVLSPAVTVTTAGTGYVEGATYPVAGVSGSGGVMTILTVDTGGEILTAEVTNQSVGYDTPTVDLTGDGDGLAEVAVSASVITALDQSTVLDDMLGWI